MKTLAFHNRCRPPRAPGLFALFAALALPAGQKPPSAPPTNAPPTPSAAATGQSAVPTPSGPPPNVLAPTGPPSVPEITYDTTKGVFIGPDGEIRADGVTLKYDGVTLTADHMEGNRREFVFSGHAKIETPGATSYADTIHYFPLTHSYRLDNPRAVLQPEFLKERVLSPVFISGGVFSGTNTGYSLAERFLATTCQETYHHYELRIGSAELFPHQRLILRHVGIVFFGQKLIVLPYIVIPLDERPRRITRTDYLPEFGQNQDEGFFARFPYQFAEGLAAASFLRFDVTQKRGEGYRFEQEYLAGKQHSVYNTNDSAGGFGATGGNGAIASAYGYGRIGPQLPRLGTGLGPENGGLFAIQGYFGEGLSRDFSASFRHQQDIGGNNRIGFVTELLRNSFTNFSDQTNTTTRLNFAHADAAHGNDAGLALNFTRNNSPGFSTYQLTGNLHQSFLFDSLGSNRNNLAYSFDFSRFVNSGTNLGSLTQRLDSQFQYEHDSRDYTLTFQANKSTPIGAQSGGGAFGTLERFPELQLSADTYNFRGGWLHTLPLHLDFGAGEYSEPSSNVHTERALMGITLQDSPILRGLTEITIGGGFEQRIYGDGAAQYIVRNNTRLRRHLGKRSGIDITYDYEQPEGGTPFLFDTYGRAHYLTAEGGYLDDRHFQLTARVGYDFLGTSSPHPWQSLSTRLMWFPAPGFRFDSLATYDPNTNQWYAVSSSVRLRARNNFAIDLFSRYDPQVGRFGQLNSQFDIPLGRTWRIAGLFRYNGYRNQFESRNLQITHDWDCLEASLTYSENPLGFRPDREIYFSLRIKAFPFSRSFWHGPAGEAVGPGIGDIY